MWFLEIRENGVYVIRRPYKKIEDAMMAVGLRYSESEIIKDNDIQIHIGYIAAKED